MTDNRDLPPLTSDRKHDTGERFPVLINKHLGRTDSACSPKPRRIRLMVEPPFSRTRDDRGREQPPAPPASDDPDSAYCGLAWADTSL